MLVFEPQIPMGLWWALAVAATAAWGLYAFLRDSGLHLIHRSVLLTLMAVVLAAPLILLLNPTWIEPIVPPSGKPLITIMVDATQSMQVEDCDEDKTRWESALEFSRRLQAASQSRFDVSVVRFGKVIKTVDLQIANKENSIPDGSNTNLAAVLRRSLAVNRPQGHAIALLSDGAHNVGSTLGVTASADNARALDIPIYTTSFGGSVGSSNVAIVVRNPQLMTFPDRPVNLRVQLSQRSYSGRTVTVRLAKDGKQIAAKRVRLNPNGPTETDFTIRPTEAGMERFVASVVPLENEASTADNMASLQVQVIDEPIRVLLLEGKPYWDTKFLARNLAADPAIELTSLVLVRKDRMMRRTDPAEIAVDEDSETDDVESVWEIISDGSSEWEDLEQLKDYRVVVLGRNAQAFLGEKAVERLQTWISREGGALVCSRGAPASVVEKALSQLLPVRWQEQSEFRARGQLTSVGQSASLLPNDLAAGSDPISALPSLAFAARPKVAIGLPQVLVQSAKDAEGRTVPIVSHQPYGSGQTVVVEGAGMWRWAFLPPDKADAQQVYASLWQGLMQWLISQQDLLPGQDVVLRSDRLAYVTGDNVTATVLVRGEQETEVPDCMVEGGGLELPKRATPVQVGQQQGVFRANFGVLPPGHYKATLEGGEPGQPGRVTEFDVRDPWFERLEVDARPGLLRQISQRSGGKLIAANEPKTIVNDFLEHLDLRTPEKSRRTPLWDRAWVLLTILGAWITCWVARRQSGLV